METEDRLFKTLVQHLSEDLGRARAEVGKQGFQGEADVVSQLIASITGTLVAQAIGRGLEFDQVEFLTMIKKAEEEEAL